MIPEVGNKIKLPKENVLIEEENIEDNTAEIVKQLHQLNQVNINSLPPIPQSNNQSPNVGNQGDQFNQMHQGNFQIGGSMVTDPLDGSPLLPQSGQKKSPLVPGKNMQGCKSNVIEKAKSKHEKIALLIIHTPTIVKLCRQIKGEDSYDEMMSDPDKWDHFLSHLNDIEQYAAENNYVKSLIIKSIQNTFKNRDKYRVNREKKKNIIKKTAISPSLRAQPRDKNGRFVSNLEPGSLAAYHQAILNNNGLIDNGYSHDSELNESNNSLEELESTDTEHDETVVLQESINKSEEMELSKSN